MSAVTMFGYLRPHNDLRAHHVADATDEQLGQQLTWTPCDWRDDPEWPCVAIGLLIIERVPTDEFAATQVQNLRKLQAGVRAAAEIKANEIEREIQQLLAITYTEAL